MENANTATYLQSPPNIEFMETILIVKLKLKLC